MKHEQSDFDKLRLALADELGPDWYMTQASQQALIAYATAPAGHSLRERRNIETAAVNQAFRMIRAGLAAGLVTLPTPATPNLRELTRQLVSEANECCHRSDGWEEHLMERFELLLASQCPSLPPSTPKE